MTPELRNENVRDLRARLEVEELEVEKRDLEAQRERLERPAVDREMLVVSSSTSSESWPRARPLDSSPSSTAW